MKQVDQRRTRARLLSGAALCSALMLAPAALAQEQTGASDEQGEALVVYGIRQSIESSIAAKRDATSIVEVISAEDIGKLPDVSIADSLARLPGVTAQRVRGRAQQISIRGLGPDFSLALLNGREQVSAGNNRGIEFDQFPSELVAQGVVYKTPDATLAATGIAGAVDLRTVRPLDYNERRINVSGKYVTNSEDQLNPDFDEDGYRLFGSYIDQNAAGTIGWSLGVTVQSNPTQFTSRELKTGNGQVSTDPVSGLQYPSDNPRTGVVSREFERTSIAGALQFEPTERLHATVDIFYSDAEDNGIFRGVETPIASWSGAAFDSATGSAPFADQATYSAVVPILRTDTEGTQSEIWSYGFNGSYDVTDQLSLTLDVSRSTLDRQDIDYESYAGTGRARSGAQDVLVYTLPGDGDYSIGHTLDYTDASLVKLTDPGGWGQVGFIKEPIIEDELSQIRGEAEYVADFGPFSSFVAGYLWSSRTKKFDSNEAFIRATAAFGASGALDIPASAILGSTDSGSIGLDIIAYDPGVLRANGSYLFEKATFDTQWTVEEDVTTFYAMGNIDTDLADIHVRGNVGVRYESTEQGSTGTLSGAGTQTVSDEFENVLPSLNLAFEITDDMIVRIAAAKSITRARLDQLAANQSISTNANSCIDTNADQKPDTLVAFNPPATVCFSLSGGNPFLQPYQSTSFDISFEKYFSRGTTLSLAFFYKDLSDWVVSQQSFVNGTQQINNFGAGAFLTANPQVALTSQNGPTNFADGEIKGFEATARVELGEFVSALDGFGVYASYTHADNQIDDASGNTTKIPGYSDEVWSADVYYEKYGWRARLNARYRSGFLSEVQLFDGSLTGADAQDELTLDTQVGYEWSDGMLDGLSVNFEIFNITDEPFVTQNDLRNGTTVIGAFPSRYEEYGRTYSLTVAKRF